MAQSFLSSLKVYREPRLLAVLFMGFASGLPLPLTFATLSAWLSEAGVSRTAIGLFVLVGFSYNWKFVWAPAFDHVRLPILGRIGRRRSWALLIQALLVGAIWTMGQNDPGQDLMTTALLAAVVAFLSASQDIVIDAYRIELLTAEEQAAGAAATQWGYRFGLLASGAGALYAAEYAGWSMAYTIMAALMLVGMATVLLTREPGAVRATRRTSIAETLRTAVVEPFADFMRRSGWATVLVFIVLYKLGDAMAGTMANPFYLELGFSKDEIAGISKIFGLVATLAGVAVGGALAARLGLLRALLLCGILQMLSNLTYAVQAMVGHDPMMLAVTIFAENFTGGMGSAAFVAYLSNLCNTSFTATQYALFSSLAAVPTRFLSAPAGWIVDHTAWVPFFLITTVAAVPGILMVAWLTRRGGFRLRAAQPAE
jgi:PAT family beta-lactamase induction signal transducer AmpG